MEYDRRTDKNPRGLAFSGIFRCATQFWIQDILPECLPRAMPDKTALLATAYKQLKCSLIMLNSMMIIVKFHFKLTESHYLEVKLWN